MGVMRPDMVMRSIIPVVMAGVLGIYGLITAVIINGKLDADTYSAYSGYAHLAAGLTVGMSFFGCRARYWYCGRRRCTSQRTAAAPLRGYYPYPYFRRGS